MNGEWRKKMDWKVSHFTRTDTVDTWMGVGVRRTACGKDVSVNDALGHEPTGSGTPRRCNRCEQVLLRTGVRSDERSV